MADFELEQLKTLFENMSAKLDETSGDVGNRRELEAIKKAIASLSDHLQKGTSGTNSSAENRQFITDFFREWDRQNPLKEVREAVEDLNKGRGGNPLAGGNTNESGEDTRGFFDKVDKNSGASKSMGRLGGAANVLTSAFGVLAGAIGTSYGWLKDQGELYRTLLSTAEGSVGSIMDMRETAARNDMSMEELVGAVNEFGSLRAMGAKEYAQMSKSFRDNTLHLGNLGMNMQQQTEAFGAYAEILRQQGNLDANGPEKMAQNFEALLGVNQEMASILGLTRKEALDAAAGAARNANFNASLRGMAVNAEEQAKIQAVMGPLSQVAPQIAALIEESTALHGTVRTEEMRNYVATDPAALALMRKMADLRNSGTFTAENLQAALEEHRQGTIDSTKNVALQAALSTQVAAGGNFGAALAAQQEALAMTAPKENLMSREARARAGDADNAILGLDEAERRIAAAADDIFNQVLNPAFEQFGGIAKDAVMGVNEFAESMHQFARWGEEHPDTMLGGGVLLGLGGLIAGTAVTALGAAGARSGLGRMFGGAGARGAAGAAGGRMGLGALAGGAARAIPIVGGLAGVGFGGYHAAQSADTTDNAVGYGSAALGGAATGAAIGAMFGGVGAIPGALIGGAIGGGGAMLYDWWDDSDSAPANATQTRRQSMPVNQQGARSAPADATGRPNNPEQQLIRINTKILDYQTESLKQLAAIKVFTQETLEAMREQVADGKKQADRVARLLEESNRNTREIRSLA